MLIRPAPCAPLSCPTAGRNSGAALHGSLATPDQQRVQRANAGDLRFKRLGLKRERLSESLFQQQLIQQFTCRSCAAAVSLLLGRIGRWSGRETDASQAERLSPSCLSIACSALSIAYSAQAERDNGSCFFVRVAGLRFIRPYHVKTKKRTIDTKEKDFHTRPLTIADIPAMRTKTSVAPIRKCHVTNSKKTNGTMNNRSSHIERDQLSITDG
ncbi:hypothetical protein EVAR_12526_1 [Eumeta japonica]|uniref:Uncharacterized protein n=1 Tax=Eumeta variegata TaxID=151549 RepID=A0A4C1TPP0_EUMVA|nr:hypothetical protein EVAR_12526_1 [Eumeta japonica]